MEKELVENLIKRFRIEKDIEEMNGHFLMFNMMLDTLEEPLTQELIKKFHYELKAGVLKTGPMDMRWENKKTAEYCWYAQDRQTAFVRRMFSAENDTSHCGGY